MKVTAEQRAAEGCLDSACERLVSGSEGKGLCLKGLCLQGCWEVLRGRRGHLV